MRDVDVCSVTGAERRTRGFRDRSFAAGLVLPSDGTGVAVAFAELQVEVLPRHQFKNILLAFALIHSCAACVNAFSEAIAQFVALLPRQLE